MARLIKQINIELTIKLAISALLASAIVVTGANAIDSSVEAQDQVNLEHKLWLSENSSSNSDDMTMEEYEEYEASQQAKEAKHANDFIAKAYGREL